MSSERCVCTGMSVSVLYQLCKNVLEEDTAAVQGDREGNAQFTATLLARVFVCDSGKIGKMYLVNSGSITIVFSISPSFKPDWQLLYKVRGCI